MLDRKWRHFDRDESSRLQPRCPKSARGRAPPPATRDDQYFLNPIQISRQGKRVLTLRGSTLLEAAARKVRRADTDGQGFGLQSAVIFRANRAVD